jgi:hypothetical protein
VAESNKEEGSKQTSMKLHRSVVVSLDGSNKNDRDKEPNVSQKLNIDPPLDDVVNNDDGDTGISVLEPPATGETETSVVNLPAKVVTKSSVKDPVATTMEKKNRKSQESLTANKKQAGQNLPQKTSTETLGQGGDGSDDSDSELSLSIGGVGLDKVYKDLTQDGNSVKTCKTGIGLLPTVHLGNK